MTERRDRSEASGDVVLIDRHVFASNVSAFDTAWRTFGWTPAIAGERAGRLEESVPWATLAAQAERPPHLRGSAAEVLGADNFDRLPFAFIPLDGRLGFSVWGAIGRDAHGPEWRVLTHTLLFDRSTFELLAGYPAGLLSDEQLGAWFREMVESSSFDRPTPLAPVAVPLTPETRTRFERARLRELGRLRQRLADRRGGAAALEQQLVTLYEALAASQGNGHLRRIALRTRGAVDDALFVRFAWLSLPLADRAEVFFTTQQRKAVTPSATLLLLPESEWGQFVPEATRLLNFAAASDQHAVSTGRRLWARLAAQDVSALAGLSARVERRGWRIIARDDVARLDALSSWREQVRRAGLTQALARELIVIECTSAWTARVRWNALGHALGCAARSAKANPRLRARDALESLRAVPPSSVSRVTHAAVRALARGDLGDRQAGALLRILTASGPERVTPITELLRLFDQERALVEPLLEHGDGPLALFRAAAELALAGHSAAAYLADQAIARMPEPRVPARETLGTRPSTDPRALRWAATVTDSILRHGEPPTRNAGLLIDNVHPEWLVHVEILDRLTAALAAMSEEGQRVARQAAALAARLVAKVLESLNGRGLSTSQTEAVLRLSWIELVHSTGPTAVERHGAGDRRAALRALVQLLVARPPLPLFLRVRRILLTTALPHFRNRPDLEHWRPQLEQYCPALAARISPPTAAGPDHSRS